MKSLSYLIGVIAAIAVNASTFAQGTGTTPEQQVAAAIAAMHAAGIEESKIQSAVVTLTAGFPTLDPGECWFWEFEACGTEYPIYVPLTGTTFNSHPPSWNVPCQVTPFTDCDVYIWIDLYCFPDQGVWVKYNEVVPPKLVRGPCDTGPCWYIVDPSGVVICDPCRVGVPALDYQNDPTEIICRYFGEGVACTYDFDDCDQKPWNGQWGGP